MLGMASPSDDDFEQTKRDLKALARRVADLEADAIKDRGFVYEQCAAVNQLSAHIYTRLDANSESLQRVAEGIVNEISRTNGAANETYRHINARLADAAQKLAELSAEVRALASTQNALAARETVVQVVTPRRQTESTFERDKNGRLIGGKTIETDLPSEV